MTQLKPKSMERIAKHVTMLNDDIDEGVRQCQCGTCESDSRVAKRVINIMQATALEVMEDPEAYKRSTENLSIVAHGVDAFMCIMMQPILVEVVDRAKSDLDGEARIAAFAQLKRMSEYLRSKAADFDDYATKLVPEEITQRASDVTEVIKKAMRQAGLSTDGVHFEVGRLSLEGKKKAPRKKRPPEG
jgi:hypothetical protein